MSSETGPTVTIRPPRWERTLPMECIAAVVAGLGVAIELGRAIGVIE